MSQVGAVTCPYCNTRFEPEVVLDGRSRRRSPDRLKGTELECSSCGGDFEFFFY